jgi:hypothetical protein
MEKNHQELRVITQVLAQILMEIPIMHKNNPLIVEVRQRQFSHLLSAVCEIGGFSPVEVSDILTEESKLLAEEYKKWERIDFADYIIDKIVKQNEEKGSS